ncbi:MAG TPA: transposase [Burkholderiaceae bacterium]|nr:transposase [Burkholderiaceae bacterium]
MSSRSQEELTRLQRVFLEPANPTHRQYEALRAYFVDGVPSAQVAARFGYTPGSFRVLCHALRQNPQREFFLPVPKGPRATPQRDTTREKVVALRKQNLSIYDISRALQEQDRRLSPAAVARLLAEAGFAKLPRRADEERPATPRAEAAAVADVRQLDLSPQRFRTQFGGLFLFVPHLARLPLEQMLRRAGFAGTAQVPAACAVRSLLAMKLFGSARHSHVMSAVFDQGLALFAGLNVIPKRSFLTEYSCRTPPAAYPKLMAAWFAAMQTLGLRHGVSFDVDYHTIPFHGEDALLQKHYVSKRSRRQKGVLAFLAQDADTRVFCYANASVRKESQNDEILRFVEYWRQRTGKLPEELVFDSKLTTYANLAQLDELGIAFITLRRRPPDLLEHVRALPASAWRRIELDGLARAYRTPRIVDEKITLEGYAGPIRQITVTDLGHEEPTLVLTNQLQRSAAKLVGRYAQRMLIENGIADGVDFFHMDALSSAVAMKVSCDLQLTLMASSLYRLLGETIGNGYATAKSRHIFRDFINAVAQVSITARDIEVRFQKRAHNPLLLAAGVAQTAVPVPWLGNKRLRFVFG